MFSVGDLVQPRAGGPKLKVVEVQGEDLVVVQAAQEQGERYTLKSDEVTSYQEEGTSASAEALAADHKARPGGGSPRRRGAGRIGFKLKAVQRFPLGDRTGNRLRHSSPAGRFSRRRYDRYNDISPGAVSAFTARHRRLNIGHQLVRRNTVGAHQLSPVFTFS